MDRNYAASLASRYGSHWFEPSTMRFFNSRVLDSTWTLTERIESQTPSGHNPASETWRFVSSERGDWSGDPRRYTVRQITFNHVARKVTIDTVGEFQQYANAATAERHIRDGAA